MDAAVESDRELLLAAARRHETTLSSEALFALVAAADELLDPTSLPAVVDVDEAATEDLATLVGAVRQRLARAATAAARPTEGFACARAARELTVVERELGPEPPRGAAVGG